MSIYAKPYLQPYKGISTRHECPSCGTKNTFTYYLDGNTNEPINNKVGRCEREGKCGYHYSPKQFFIDNPPGKDDSCLVINNVPPKPPLPPRAMGEIPFEYVGKSASYKSNFVRFLCEFMTTEQMNRVGENYALGATKTNEVIFWQIDTLGKVRTGKIMQYNPKTGKRIKHESGAIDWIHNKLKQLEQLPQDYNLQQCFFGEHLLKMYPKANVAIVESEKSALIASVIMPNFIWLAAGNLNGLSVEKCRVLAGRYIVLYPDLGAFEKWSLKAVEIQKQYNCKISVSTLLEEIASDADRENGLDIADFIIQQKLAEQTVEQIQERFSPALQNMVEQNKALLILIDNLELEEVTANQAEKANINIINK